MPWPVAFSDFLLDVFLVSSSMGCVLEASARAAYVVQGLGVLRGLRAHVNLRDHNTSKTRSLPRIVSCRKCPRSSPATTASRSIAWPRSAISSRPRTRSAWLHSGSLLCASWRFLVLPGAGAVRDQDDASGARDGFKFSSNVDGGRRASDRALSALSSFDLAYLLIVNFY